MRRVGTQGFTLIELMIVIAIIGVLASIAIPQFMSYRMAAFNTAAMWDLRNASAALEAYYADWQRYTSNLDELLPIYGLSRSEGVVLEADAGEDSYVIEAHHTKGNRIYKLDGPGGTIENRDR